MFPDNFRFHPVIILVFVLNYVELFFAQMVTLEPPVVLKELSGGHTVIGDVLKLECTTTFHSRFVSIEWDKPEDVESSSFKLETVSNENTTSRLTINAAKLGHAGPYKCKVTHREWNYTVYSNELLVPVYSEGEHVVEFDTSSFYYDRLNAEIQVNIKAHPNISVTWFDKNNKTITNGPSSRYLVNVEFPTKNREFNYYTTLQFKNVTNEDFGPYKIVTKSEFEADSITIGPFIGGIRLIKSIMYSINTAIVEFKCTMVGRKILELKWLYIPCNRSKCLDDFSEMNRFLLMKDVKSYEIEATSSEDKGIHKITYLELNLTSPGFVICYPGYDGFLRQKPSLLFYIENDFAISTQNTYVEYQEKVKILCTVSLDKYLEEMRWYHNGKNVDEEDRFYNFFIKKYESLNKILVQLSFTYMYENHAGNYSCEVLTRNGEIHKKNVTVAPRNQTIFYPEITVEDLNNGRTVVQEDIRLRCKVVFHKYVLINWEEVTDDEVFEIKNVKQIVENQTVVNPGAYLTTSEITITGTDSVDNDLHYRCGQNYNDNYRVIEVLVNDKDNESIIFGENDMAFDDQNIRIEISLWADPLPTIRWFSNTGEEILGNSSSKFQISSYSTSTYYENNYITTLIFKNGIEVSDFGNYTVVANNLFSQENYSVEIMVTEEVSTFLDLQELYEANKTAVIKCSALGNPQPYVQWHYAKCDSMESCLEDREDFEDLRELYHERKGLLLISYLSVNVGVLGFIKCHGTNDQEEKYDYMLLHFFGNGFDISVRDKRTNEFLNTSEFVGDAKIGLGYGIYARNYTDEVQCFLFDLYKLEFLKLTSILLLPGARWSTFEMDVSLQSPGNYSFVCNALTKDGCLKSRSRLLRTEAQPSLYIYESNMLESTVEQTVSSVSNFTFNCYVRGFPTPVVHWYKNDQPIESSERVQITNNSHELHFRSITLDDKGTYECKASNGFTVTTKRETLVVNFDWMYVLVASLLLALVVILGAIAVILKLRKENKLIRELKLAGLFYFEMGDLDNLNPELRIEDQAELLPYDKKWEIPKQYIKLGKQLGSGAFGVVFEARIVDGGNTKIAAVKTLSKYSDFDCVKALASELKIMGHLGKHLNVVNLLGGCTKNITKKELYVIVEYCRFGNILDHVQRHSENFIDQKDYESGEFDWTKQSVNESAIYSRDFLLWAFQIVKGMEYLVSRRIVHGDLAARNVLLTDDNVVKVSDFGLAKRIYQDSNYIKKKGGRLPIKWMAIESISKGIFSIQSDVWSFGVVLWEIFSLAKTPYPGMSVDETFYKKLTDGYRMEPPKTATNTLYELMLSCWDSDPLLRPSFTQLAEKLGLLLEEPVRSYYMEMSNNFMLMNKHEPCNDTEDYLTMVSVPTFENIVSGGNTNGANGEPDSGYV